jgi:hypothetical protein
LARANIIREEPFCVLINTNMLLPGECTGMSKCIVEIH